MILNNLIKLHGKKFIKILKCLIFDLYILKKIFFKKLIVNFLTFFYRNNSYVSIDLNLLHYYYFLLVLVYILSYLNLYFVDYQYFLDCLMIIYHVCDYIFVVLFNVPVSKSLAETFSCYLLMIYYFQY